MSMIACDYCDRLIDSDDDPGCFIDAPTCIPYNKNLEQVLCEPCRDAAHDRATEQAMEDAPIGLAQRPRVASDLVMQQGEQT